MILAKRKKRHVGLYWKGGRVRERQALNLPQCSGIDLVVALVGGVLLSPLFLIVAVLIKLDSTGPIFFRQERVGTGSRPLNILKFRTVDDDVEKRGRLITAGNDPRVTGRRKVLRKTSLAVKTLSVTD